MLSVFLELLLPGVGLSSTVQRKQAEHRQPAQERATGSLTLQKALVGVQDGLWVGGAQVYRLSVVETGKAWGQGAKGGAGAHLWKRDGSRAPESEQAELQPASVELETRRFQLRSFSSVLLHSPVWQEEEGRIIQPSTGTIQSSILQHRAPLNPHSTGSINECFSRLTGSSEVKSV